MDEQICMRGKKFKLYPTEEQKELIDRFIEIYRFVYNWGITKLEESYEAKKLGLRDRNYNFYDLGRMFTEYRKKPENEWLLALPFNTAKLALREVCHNYQRFYDGYVLHIPKKKSSNSTFQRFKTRHNRFYIDKNKIRFEGLKRFSTGPGAKVDMVNIRVDSGFSKSDNITYYEPCIHKDNIGQYWVSFVVKEPIITLDTPKTEIIGVDLGIRKTMTLSTGEVFNRPQQKLDKLYKRLRRKQRHVARDNKRRAIEAKSRNVSFDEVLVSKRSIKRSIETKKLFKRITNIKHHFYHEIIKQIVLRNPEAIGIETIEVRRLMKKRHANRKFLNQLGTADFYTIRKIFEDKCEKYNIRLVEADPEYPSSQICSNCGHIRRIDSQHTYICHNCGTRIDRDLNAAINLRNLASVSM